MAVGRRKLPLTWYSAPVTNFLGWGLTGMLIVLFCMPFLLVKNLARSEQITCRLWSGAPCKFASWLPLSQRTNGVQWLFPGC